MSTNNRLVKFSLTKYTKNGPFKITGYGEIDNENLYTKDKVYEDCIRYCHKVLDKTDEFKGCFSQFEYIEVENSREQLDTIEVENNYFLWYRILE